MLKKDKLILEKYNGIHPLCQCGCGQKTNYEYKLKDFHKYISGHHSRKEGHWGDWNNKDRVEKISKTRKEKFASGKYNYIKEAIKNRDKKELGEKISKGAKGIAKPKPENFGKGRIQSEETKEKMSKSHIDYILKSGKVKRSNLEFIFEGLLKSLEINFIHSYYIPEIKKIFDFYIPEFNILIEVDGDFWHCNPKKFLIPECKTQKINIENDKFKNEWALQNNIKLIRFWENDINNNIKQVKNILLENFKKIF